MIYPGDFYCGDSLVLLDLVKPESIDLAITSPPYKDEDGWTETLMYGVFLRLYACLKPNSLFFLNFGHLAEDKFRPFQTCSIAMQAGFKLNETFTWAKNHFRPIQGDKRVNNLTEFVFLLYKGNMPAIDRLSIGVPYKDISNAKRFSGGRNLRCRGNLWEIPYQTINKKEEKLHNDRFPVQLPEFCIKLSGIPQRSVVIDPFCGSGTVALASVALQMSYIGFDKDPHWIEISRERIAPFACIPC